MGRCPVKKGAKKKRRYRSYGLEFKIEAVKRVGNGERVSAVARDLDVRRSVLNRWRKEYRHVIGAGRLRGPGRPRNDEGVVVSPAEMAARRTAELERKIGQQEVEIDFLRRAFERVKGLRQPSSGPGGAASTERSDT
jgi:transposase-like protein